MELTGTYDQAPIWKTEYRPDGEQIVMSVEGCCSNAGAPQPSVRLVDAATLTNEPVQLGGIPASLFVSPPDYSGDGRFVAAAFESVGGVEKRTAVAVWSLASPEQPVLEFEVKGTGRGVVLSLTAVSSTSATGNLRA